jgi:hypothetical protein
MIDQYLDDLEARIDDAVEERLFKDWTRFADGRFEGSVFSPMRDRKIALLRCPGPKRVSTKLLMNLASKQEPSLTHI